jgi:hypothetical protein
MKSYFPDLNVWIAMAYDGHEHHQAALPGFQGCMERRLFLPPYPARVTPAAHDPERDAARVRTQAEAWLIYDSFLYDSHVSFQSEVDAEQVDAVFRRLTSAPCSHGSNGRVHTWQLLPVWQD